MGQAFAHKLGHDSKTTLKQSFVSKLATVVSYTTRVTHNLDFDTPILDVVLHCGNDDFTSLILVGSYGDARSARVISLMRSAQEQWSHTMTDFFHIVVGQLGELVAFPERWHTLRHRKPNLVELDSVESAHVGPDTDSTCQDGKRPEQSKSEDLY